MSNLGPLLQELLPALAQPIRCQQGLLLRCRPSLLGEMLRKLVGRRL